MDYLKAQMVSVVLFILKLRSALKKNVQSKKPYRFVTIDFEKSETLTIVSVGWQMFICALCGIVCVRGVDLAAHVNVFVSVFVCETLSSSLQVENIYRIVN